MKLATRIPVKVGLALSGGQDSMGALNFLLRGKREVTSFYFNHGTKHGKEAEEFVSEFCTRKGLELIVGRLATEIPAGVSKEAFWRDQRYAFLSQWKGEMITAHHLDDAVETYVSSILKGKERIIPHIRGNYIRPFLLMKGGELKSFADEYIVDPSNGSLDYERNKLRHQLVPTIKQFYPGLDKVVRKKILEAALRPQ